LASALASSSGSGVSLGAAAAAASGGGDLGRRADGGLTFKTAFRLLGPVEGLRPPEAAALLLKVR